MDDPWKRLVALLAAALGLAGVIVSQIVDFRSEEVYGWTVFVGFLFLVLGGCTALGT